MQRCHALNDFSSTFNNMSYFNWSNLAFHLRTITFIEQHHIYFITFLDLLSTSFPPFSISPQSLPYCPCCTHTPSSPPHTHSFYLSHTHISPLPSSHRMFKLDTLEPDCEDYGQAVIYHGTLPDHPYFFRLDNHHKIMTGKVTSQHLSCIFTF
jgi:hypothetical protein